MKFVKINFISFNLVHLFFYTCKSVNKQLEAFFLHQMIVNWQKLITCWDKECQWMCVIALVWLIFIMQYGTTELNLPNKGCRSENCCRQQLLLINKPNLVKLHYSLTQKTIGGWWKKEKEDNKKPLDCRTDVNEVKRLLLELRQSVP